MTNKRFNSELWQRSYYDHIIRDDNDYIYHIQYVEENPRKWRRIEVGAGELVTSYKNLAEQTGHSVQEVRTAMDKLKKSGVITVRATSRYSVISLVNYSVYQGFENAEQQANNSQNNKQITNNQHSSNTQATTNNNDNNYNKYNNDKKYRAKNKNKDYFLKSPPSFDIKKIEYEAMFNEDYDI